MNDLYLAKDGQQLGPFDEDTVRAGLREGRFSPVDLAWREGMTDWKSLSILMPGFGPPPLPVRPGPVPIGENAGIRMLLPVGRSGWAISAGYAGLFAFLVVPAPLALILSLVAIWDIRRSRRAGKKVYGMGRAIFGLVTGVLGTAVLIGALFLG
jgi:hypothetical protein